MNVDMICILYPDNWIYSKVLTKMLIKLKTVRRIECAFGNAIRAHVK